MFLRMESINRKTEMNELRISKVETHMEIASTQTAEHKDEMKTAERFRVREQNASFRRSLISDSGNKSLTIEDVPCEITQHGSHNSNSITSTVSSAFGESNGVPGSTGKKETEVLEENEGRKVSWFTW
ncbi:hypothetical protein OS493_034316 [Desmophyllum pertusum]|uniref:Uncharacterized protein n=1 Tax=Desmophyllum pertusum TaxID=174260 RepID=A0A9W9YVE5_9CNID|nr:hypothetical protein OS493_034316 [Desmophyllum pertusum]